MERTFGRRCRPLKQSPASSPWLLALLGSSLLVTPTVSGQETGVRWQIDPQSSLVWWQIDPHYSHLWATTCPDDPSWQPGEGRGGLGLAVDYMKRPKTVAAGRSDPRVPLYPRDVVHSLCQQAVHGALTVTDTDSWGLVDGEVVVQADSLITGLAMRDKFAHHKVLETNRYPEVRFTLEELRDVKTGAGDTIQAIAVGTFTLHGVEQPAEVPVSAWYEGDALRVKGKWGFPAQDLTKVYDMSKWALGMGVVMRRWETVYMGLDLILRREDEARSSNP